MTNLSNSTQEIWKDIPGWEGQYQVSNMGRVKSLEKRVNSRYGKRLRPEKMITCRVMNTGYVSCSLHTGKKAITKFVHRLVLTAFKGLPPKGCDVIMHKNDIKTDNRPDNLKWATQSENIKESFDKGRAKALNKKKVLAINLLTGEQFIFDSVQETSEKLGVQRANLNKVIRGVREKTLNYSFKYL